MQYSERGSERGSREGEQGSRERLAPPSSSPSTAGRPPGGGDPRQRPGLIRPLPVYHGDTTPGYSGAQPPDSQYAGHQVPLLLLLPHLSSFYSTIPPEPSSPVPPAPGRPVPGGDAPNAPLLHGGGHPPHGAAPGSPPCGAATGPPPCGAAPPGGTPGPALLPPPLQGAPATPLPSKGQTAQVCQVEMRCDAVI